MFYNKVYIHERIQCKADYCPVCQEKVSKIKMKQNGLQPASPYINPIENLQSIIKKYIQDRKTVFNQRGHLGKIVIVKRKQKIKC